MSASQQFLIVYILLCPRDHLGDVKEFLLPDPNELLQLLRSVLLRVGSFVVDGGPRPDLRLLRKGFQILLILQGHLRSLLWRHSIHSLQSGKRLLVLILYWCEGPRSKFRLLNRIVLIRTGHVWIHLRHLFIDLVHRDGDLARAGSHL